MTENRKYFDDTVKSINSPRGLIEYIDAHKSFNSAQLVDVLYRFMELSDIEPYKPKMLEI